MKKVVVGLLVAALVAVGVMGGTVLAQSADENPVQSFAERVAEILGLDSATVENAMEQAKSDIAEERVQAWLDKMVAADKMTQEQADAYSTWYESRPEGVGAGFDYKKGRGDRGWFGHKKGRGDHRWFGHEKGRGDYGWGEKDSYDWGEKDSDSTTSKEGTSL